jgi:hypothetical protein
MESKELTITNVADPTTFRIIPQNHYNILHVKKSESSQYFHSSSITEMDLYTPFGKGYPCRISIGPIGFQKNIFYGYNQTDCERVFDFLTKNFM